MDRIERGGEDKWINLLRNKENPLPNGWFCVKQPDLPQLRSGISWEDAKAAERKFFDERSPWSLLDGGTRGRLGSAGLAEQLGKILSELVAQKCATLLSSLSGLNSDRPSASTSTGCRLSSRKSPDSFDSLTTSSPTCPLRTLKTPKRK